ncbi:hypothetical protein HHK36_012614 [Tetracentron sinense]|uniref:FAF domain-containing protein n=1 Tax=Tetracentron sinense TaxID=13715 RepID=A0A835DFM9_TETSI|nr:hypothetical protein HHK36_012614 [Tetracentron sinense]
MSSKICQGRQSCLEPRLVEPLRLKLASLKPHFSQSLGLDPRPLMPDIPNTMELGEKCYSEEDKNMTNEDNGHNNSNKTSNTDLGGWSFIQALNNTSQCSHNAGESKGKESIYVHPLVKRTSSMLSKKSLELCTENLGCETGTNNSENTSFSSSSSNSETGMCTNNSENTSFSSSSSNSETGMSPTRVPLKLQQLSGHKKVNCRNFPPPLTSMSSSSHVRSHREGGRLVIKAVTIPSSNTNFQAERGNGRLVLRFSKEYAPNFDSKAAENQIEAHEEEDDDEAAAAKQEEYEKLDDVYLDEEEMEGVNGNVKGEMGKGMFDRPSRCKEDRRGNEGVLGWEPFNWVATS